VPGAESRKGKMKSAGSTKELGLEKERDRARRESMRVGCGESLPWSRKHATRTGVKEVDKLNRRSGKIGEKAKGSRASYVSSGREGVPIRVWVERK